MNTDCDVIVIGAGPAGAACACFLGRAGLRVRVLDQARFPRDKVCGEFISPAADDILEAMGVLEAVESLSPLRLQGVALSSYGRPEITLDYPPDPQTGEARTSLSLTRWALDPLLVNGLIRSGAELRPGHRVEELLFDGGRIAGVRGRTDSGSRFRLQAPWVVDAGGRASLSIRRLNLKRRQGGRARIALAAHWRGVHFPRPYCYMHVAAPGYTGMAPVTGDSVNVVLVVPADAVRGRGIDEYYVETVLAHPLRREILEGGEVQEKVRTVDSLAYSVAPVPVAGLMLVGDAMGFIDPFTGEGIYLSLRSAQMAAAEILVAVEKGGAGLAAVANYEAARQREFGRKFMLSRILQQCLYRPWLCNRIVTALETSPRLGETLAGVIGDYVPATKVVRARFLFDLLQAMTRGSGRKPGLRRDPEPAAPAAVD